MITRRNFLSRVGQAGGYTAAFSTMQALGLMPLKGEPKLDLQMDNNTGKGVNVVILGGGIAGLVSAYELRRHGFKPTVLEARERPGGRNWSVRGGTKIVFTDGTTQNCQFDEGHYQNVGPARLASIHETMLGYCKELQVKLEVEINTSRSDLLQSDAANQGVPIVQRQVINDTRGHVSELLNKCIAGGALDQELSKDDLQSMRTFLRTYGPLDANGVYKGSDRAGYTKLPGAGDDAGVLNVPVDLHVLLQGSYWRNTLDEETFDWQATMFQPVGGMDRIPYAFARSLGNIVQYNSPVKEIRRNGNGVRIVYEQNGTQHTIEADYCICAMPLTMVQQIPTDFSPAYQQVIAAARYNSQYKIAWESRRFWEQDYNIYGGLSYVREGPSPVWYPSGDLFSERGIILSGYSGENGAFADMTIEQKLAASRASVEKLHPGHGKELEKGVYVEWTRIPWNLGSWIAFFGGRNGAANPSYETLIQPDGPFYFAGDHCSHLNAWQEGAALAAVRAVKMIGDRVKAA